MKDKFFGLAALFAIFAAAPAGANTLQANFTLNEVGPASVSGGNVTFTLNDDGTIAANLVSFDGAIFGFAFDSSIHFPSHDFSEMAVDSPWATRYGTYNSGLDCDPVCGGSITWTIGAPGDFTSVWQALDGTFSTFDFFLYTYPSRHEWAANAGTPLPAALPLFAGGLGVIGLLARRRKQRHAAALPTG